MGAGGEGGGAITMVQGRREKLTWWSNREAEGGGEERGGVGGGGGGCGDLGCAVLLSRKPLSKEHASEPTQAMQMQVLLCDADMADISNDVLQLILARMSERLGSH